MSNPAILLVARIFMSIMFLMAGFAKLGAVGGTIGYFTSLGLPAPNLLVWVIIALEIGGGIAILTGFMTAQFSYALAGFCIAAGFIGHFDPSDQSQMNAFMKNITIAGGFLVLAVMGPGAWSLDARRSASLHPA